MFRIDPSVFQEDAISDEIRQQNADIIARLSAIPDKWQFEPAEIRARRLQGLDAFPPGPKVDHAQTIEIAGPGGAIPIRVIAPQSRSSRGIYLHFHGGGWTIGQSDFQDGKLERIAETCGLTALSVEYRLAPEHPYPAGPDDCEAAALWAIDNLAQFGGDALTIGGESAGAHLSVVTLVRLRDRHGLTPFSGANLVAGCYDHARTLSSRRFAQEKLILNDRDIRNFTKCFLADGGDIADPDISPIHADLAGLPPALFSIGTYDPLLDDSLFMAQRWLVAGNKTELGVFPGGCHVFQSFPSAMAEASLARMDDFLNGLIA